MGSASADFSTSGHGTPVRRRRRGVRLRLRRRRSPTPSSIDATTQELARSSSAASVYQQPPFLPYPDPDDAIGFYFPVAPLPVFRGDPAECPDAHVARFDRVRRANGAVTPAAAARIFPASLDGDAALWYELTASGAGEDSPPPPWHAVRAAFLDFFRPPGAADRARAELVALRQGPGEAINRYHLRMQGILRRCSNLGADIPDALLKAAFVGGLRTEFQDWVAPQRPTALDEAVALALSWERAESVREARRAATSARAAVEQCSFCGTEGHEEPQCEVRMRMRELWQRSSSSGGGRGGAMVVAEDGEQAEEGGVSMALARLGSAVSTRSTQCQCRKHQCGRRPVAAIEVAASGDVDGVASVK